MSQGSRSGSGDVASSPALIGTDSPPPVDTRGAPDLSASYTANGNTIPMGSLIAFRRPDEKVTHLQKIEVQMLLDGDVAGARAGRDMSLGFCISAMIGLISLLATVDWSEVFTKGRWGAALWAALMLAIVLASAIAAVIFEVRRHELVEDSAYSSLIGRLREDFGISPKKGLVSWMARYFQSSLK